MLDAIHTYAKCCFLNWYQTEEWAGNVNAAA